METSLPVSTEALPVANARGPGADVVIAGLVTTALSLAGVYAVGESFNVMGWYLNYVIPAGALLVGLAAGSGYGFASWKTGVKISSGLLLAVLGLQIAAFFTAQYLSFLQFGVIEMEDGSQLGFLEYFDLVTRAFAFQNKDGTPGTEMGLWGYAFRLLELAGFAGGGSIAPAILRAVPYCERCQRYMKTSGGWLIGASVPVRKIKKADLEGQAAYDAEQAAAIAAGQALLAEASKAAGSGNDAGFRELVERQREHKKANGKLPVRFVLNVEHCPQCGTGALVAKQLTGQGDQVQTLEVGRWEVGPTFTSAAKSLPT